MSVSSVEAEACAADSSDPELSKIRDIIDLVRQDAEHWAQELLVTIGRASAISGLKESQIRYYEGLGALQPATTTGRAGASRLYGLSDLRRLRTLALLSATVKPAEAAELVRQYADQIDHGAPIALKAALAQEQNAIADGFFLARTLSQVIAALEAECGRLLDVDPDAVHGPIFPRIAGVLYPGRRLFTGPTPSPAAIADVADALCRDPRDTLVALCAPHEPIDPEEWAPELGATTGSDVQTLLFYSHEARPITDLASRTFLAYIPACAPEHTLLIALRCAPPDPLPTLDPTTLLPGRAAVLDRMLLLTQAMLGKLRANGNGRGLRYRSDGFPLKLTRESYTEMLRLIAELIFPGDTTSLAVMLVPDGLDQPTSLSILAHHGYAKELVARAKISLNGNGQGLSGRAYVQQEVYVSLHAHADKRVRYGHEEHCRVALAIPLKATWGMAPFGVLYLASRDPAQTLPNTAMFSALAIGGILSELLGRWWLTRLRKEQDARLHGQMTTLLDWLDSLDAHGPGFERGIARLTQLWKQIDAGDRARSGSSVALAVIDINHYRETIQIRSNDIFPVYAQRHVRKAIGRVLGAAFADCYWFGNDHALLVLEDHDRERAISVAERIADQVADSPVRLSDARRSPHAISVSVAIKVIGYRSLHDLGRDDSDALRQHLQELVDYLRDRAGSGEAQTRVFVVDR